MLRFLLFLLLVSPGFCSGCRLFQAAGERTSNTLNRFASSGTQRRSMLDELESDQPEYLLDSVFKKKKDNRNPEIGLQNQDQARQYFSQADQLYRQAASERDANPEGSGHVATFVQAAKLYRKAGDNYINSTLEQEAIFKAGESYFFADYFKKAADQYDKLIKEYSGSRYSDVVQVRRFAIAKFWLEQSKNAPQSPIVLNFGNEKRPLRDTAGNAMRILNRIRLDHATGKLADDATLMLANAHFENGRFLEAADAYEDLRINFPKSEHQFHAHLFEMKARLQAYQGPQYDGTHLATAEKLIKALQTQFPREAAEQQELLRTEAGRVRKMMAEREISIAKYYENRGAYQAAGMHYQKIAKNFPNTPAAEVAETRYAKIDDKPAKSNEAPEWVARLFPESKPADPIFGTSLKSQIR